MTPHYTDESLTLYQGDALTVLSQLDPGSVDCIVTSPPYYGLRDYGNEGQYGLESSPAEYVETMRRVFAEARRVLTADGTLWLNIGDSYSGGGGGPNPTKLGTSSADPIRQGATAMLRESPPGYKGMPAKNMLGIPWRLAFALQDDGWTLRNDIIWAKPNAMPESVTDRLSCRYEHVFLFTRSRRYWFDLDPIREAHADPDDALRARRVTKASDAARQYGHNSHGSGGYTTGGNPAGRNPGDVWTIPTTPFSGGLRTARQRPDRHDQDGPAYGMERIASPDCPVHGSAGRPDSSSSDGEREVESATRSAGTDGSPALGRVTDSDSTSPHHEHSTQDGSSDSTRQQCGSAAMSRSNGTRRTDPAPATTQPYTTSARTPDDTARTEGLLDFDVPENRSDESSNGGRGSHASPARTRSRSADRCTCSWTDNTVTTSHFAVMPVTLAERCIQAGCKPGGTVLDPFSGSGTTGLAAARHGRRYIGIDLSAEYLNMSLRTRLGQMALIADD